MVGIMAARSREKVAGLIDSAKSAMDIPSKLEHLRQLKVELTRFDSGFLSEFLPLLLDLHTDRFSPVRKFIIEMVGDIGLKHMEFIPEIVPVLITVLEDGTPAVARQAVACGVELFRSTLIKVAIQGLYSSELDGSLESSWAWVLRFRDKICSIAFQPGSDGIRLPAVKFVEAVILLYTPDPSGSSEPPRYQTSEEKLVEFNVSWIRGGHPLLNVGDFSIEASQSLGLLLDELRLPMVNSLSNSMIIVLINSLSAIAKKRPSLIAYAGKCCQVGVAVDIGSTAFMTSLNLLSNTIFSVDLADLCVDSAKELRDLVWNVMMETGKRNLVVFFPVLAMSDPQGIRNRAMVHLEKILQLFGGLIDERLKSRKLHKSNAENDVRDILLNLNQEIDRTHIERMCLVCICYLVAMAELLRNPECLKKATAELEQTIGKVKPIQERDTSQLPYLQAIPRKVETDVEIYGYTVPKGAQVLVNVWAIGRDPSIWKNPTTFMPERLLELDIEVRGHDFELIPFGAGRRICRGLPLAIRTIPAVLGSLIN